MLFFVLTSGGGVGVVVVKLACVVIFFRSRTGLSGVISFPLAVGSTIANILMDRLVRNM